MAAFHQLGGVRGLVNLGKPILQWYGLLPSYQNSQMQPPPNGLLNSFQPFKPPGVGNLELTTPFDSGFSTRKQALTNRFYWTLFLIICSVSTLVSTFSAILDFLAVFKACLPNAICVSWRWGNLYQPFHIIFYKTSRLNTIDRCQNFSIFRMKWRKQNIMPRQPKAAWALYFVISHFILKLYFFMAYYAQLRGFFD